MTQLATTLASSSASAWVPRIANWLLVTMVSMLLWLWAAGSTEREETLQILVRFVSADPDRVQVEPLQAITVDLSLKGARREIDAMSTRLSGRTLHLLIGQAGVPSDVGEHSILLANVLRRSDAVGSGASSIVGAKPDIVTVVITETEVLNASVVPVLPGVQLEGDVVVEPATAKVILPRALAGPFGTTPRIDAFVPAADTESLPAGRRQTIDALLRVPEVLSGQRQLIRIEPDRVRITFTLRSRSSSAIVGLVPVQIAGPPADLENYQIEVHPDDAFLRDVHVSGPDATIQAINEGRAPVLAFVHLSADDLARLAVPAALDESVQPGARAQVVLWMLPDGVTVTRIGAAADARPTVRLTIVQRSRS